MPMNPVTTIPELNLKVHTNRLLNSASKFQNEDLIPVVDLVSQKASQLPKSKRSRDSFNRSSIEQKSPRINSETSDFRQFKIQKEISITENSETISQEGYFEKLSH
jgi:hypothetical protein